MYTQLLIPLEQRVQHVAHSTANLEQYGGTTPTSTGCFAYELGLFLPIIIIASFGLGGKSGTELASGPVSVFEESVLVILVEFIPVAGRLGGVFGDSEGGGCATILRDEVGDGGFDRGLFGKGLMWGWW